MTDARFKEHVEISEERVAGALQTFQYSKNQAFDDLMDVLRDDQGSYDYFLLIQLFCVEQIRKPILGNGYDGIHKLLLLLINFYSSLFDVLTSLIFSI